MEFWNLCYFNSVFNDIFVLRHESVGEMNQDATDMQKSLAQDGSKSG